MLLHSSTQRTRINEHKEHTAIQAQQKKCVLSKFTAAGRKSGAFWAQVTFISLAKVMYEHFIASCKTRINLRA